MTRGANQFAARLFTCSNPRSAEWAIETSFGNFASRLRRNNRRGSRGRYALFGSGEIAPPPQKEWQIGPEPVADGHGRVRNRLHPLGLPCRLEGDRPLYVAEPRHAALRIILILCLLMLRKRCNERRVETKPTLQSEQPCWVWGAGVRISNDSFWVLASRRESYR